MMKRILAFFIFLAIFADVFASIVEKYSNSKEIALGLCRPNLVWVKPQARQFEILDEIKASGAKYVQLTLRENTEPTFEHIAYCNKIGLNVTMVIMPLETLVEDGAKRRPKVENLWSVYGISQIDLSKYEESFRKWVSIIKEKNLKIDALEIFNEINWADFNGDLSAVKGGAILTESNYKDYEFSKKYFDGMRKYSKLIAMMRKVLDEQFDVSKTKLKKPILLLGSFVMTDANWVQKISASVIDADFHNKILAGKFKHLSDVENVFSNVDACATHIYPNQETIREIESDKGEGGTKAVKKYTDVILKYSRDDMLIFITEFSFSSYIFRNEENPQASRANATDLFLKSLSKGKMRNINFGAIFHYSYDDSDNWAIYWNSQLRKPMANLFLKPYPRAYINTQNQ